MKNMKKILLIITILLSVFYVNGKIIDEGNVVSQDLKDMIDDTKGNILLLIKNSSTDLYDDSNTIFIKENPKFMISIQLDNKDMYLLHSKQEIHDTNKIAQIIEKYKTRKSTIQTKDELNKFLIDVTNDVKGLVDEKQMPKLSKKAIYCANIKDGFCDNTCPTVDIDCLCGDNICQSFETEITCNGDCKIEHKKTCAFISDNICDEECFAFDIDCKLEEYQMMIDNMQQTMPLRYSIIKWSLVFVLVCLAGILIYLIHKQVKGSIK